MAAKKRRRKRKKKIEVSKKLAYWAASVATLSAASSLLLSAFGRDPVGELTGTIFTACVGYLITYAGKSLGEKISRNRHGLDADGSPRPDRRRRQRFPDPVAEEADHRGTAQGADRVGKDRRRCR